MEQHRWELRRGIASDKPDRCPMGQVVEHATFRRSLVELVFRGVKPRGQPNFQKGNRLHFCNPQVACCTRWHGQLLRITTRQGEASCQQADFQSCRANHVRYSQAVYSTTKQTVEGRQISDSDTILVASTSSQQLHCGASYPGQECRFNTTNNQSTSSADAAPISARHPQKYVFTCKGTSLERLGAVGAVAHCCDCCC